jgi:AcrR family transcriptional regulator
VERRVEQRQRLVRAAIEEFAALGYLNTSVEDIVRAARSSRTAFYSFFDNREDAMYAALHSCLRAFLSGIRTARERQEPERGPVDLAVRTVVDALVDDPSAARILLFEGVGVSADVNALRSRLRLELANEFTVCPSVENQKPMSDVLRAAIFGSILEPMAHLVETNRLAEARSHIPELVAAVERLIG